MFTINQAYLEKAKMVLAQRPSSFWIVGGSCTGKSTITQALAKQHNLPVYDMDTKIYGEYMPRYSAERHPAISQWLGAENPLDWMLSLTWAEFNAYNQAADVEYLDLLAEDFEKMGQRPLLIDGGFTHPAILAQIVPVETLVCLDVDHELSVQEWETNPGRAEMREWIQSLTNPAAKWQTFLDFDHRMTQTMVAESKAKGIAVFRREVGTAVADLVAKISQYFGLKSNTEMS